MATKQLITPVSASKWWRFDMGWASGFQAGSQVAKQALDTYNQIKQQQGLEAAFAKPESYSDYSPEDVKRIQAAQTSGLYNVEAVPGAEGVAPTLRYTPKEGLSPVAADDYRSPAPNAPIEIAPQQVQRYGGQTVAGQFDPNVLRGLQMREAARVVGANGDPIRAAQLMQQAEDIEYQAQRRPLELEGLKQQVDTGKLTLEQQKRVAADAVKMDTFNNRFAEANAAALAEGRTLSPTEISNLAKESKLTYNQENELIAGHVNRSKAEVESFRLDMEKATQGKNFEQLIDLHKNDKRFNDGVHFVPEVDKKTGGVVLARVNEATGQVEERLPFKTKAEATAYLREEAVNPANAAIWLQNFKKGETAIEANRAQIRASDSTVNLNAAKAEQTRMQSSILKMNVENNTEAKALQTELAKLDDESDPTGNRRANLIAQFNMLAAGPGKTIPMGGLGRGGKSSVLQTPVELKKNDDGTYTAYSKDGGRALYNTYNGEEIPLGMEVDAYKKTKEAAVKNGVGLVTGEDNGRLTVKFAGADGKFYDSAEKAKYAKPAPAAAKNEGLDTSTKTVVAPATPTVPTAKPVREPNESFTAFKDRTIAWDQNRMAYEKYLNDQRVQNMLSGNASGLQLGNRPLVR
jgi:hypothetical protein